MVMPPDASVRPRYVGRSRARETVASHVIISLSVGSNYWYSQTLPLVRKNSPKALPVFLSDYASDYPRFFHGAVGHHGGAFHGRRHQQARPRFLSLLQQNDVSLENIAKLGTAGCKTIALFGHVGKDEARLEAYLKAVLNLDPTARAEDFIPVAQLVIVWTACRKRSEVETEAQAQRVVNHLPPQLTA